MKLPADYDLERTKECILCSQGGHLVDKIYLLNDFKEIEKQVPEKWRNISNKSTSEAIDFLWGECKPYAPNFIKYLKKSLITLFWGRGEWGVVLIYFLKDWEKTDIGLIDGAFVAGIPALEDNIEKFEMENGILPSSLKSLWRIHGFLYLKNNSLICGLNNKLFSTIAFPYNIGLKVKDKKTYECLAFANVWKEFAYCYIREFGKSNWEELLVHVEKNSNIIHNYEFWGFDELLMAEI